MQNFDKKSVQSSSLATTLVVAGSDSGAGAGVQADLRICAALGVYAMTAITAVTAQNSCGVIGVLPCDEILQSQIDACIADLMPGSVKTGMLRSARNVSTVADAIRGAELHNVVVDPVILSTSGYPLLEEEGVERMVTELFPLATLITPNIPELERILQIEHLSGERECADAACLLISRCGGGCSVLVKGGHNEDSERITDLLVMPDGREIPFTHARLATQNTHGTGCALSTAIAANLAKGMALEMSVEVAVEWLQERMCESAAVTLWPGHGPSVI